MVGTIDLNKEFIHIKEQLDSIVAKWII